MFCLTILPSSNRKRALICFRSPVIRSPEDQAHLRRLGLFHFAHFKNEMLLDLFPSQKVHEQGHVFFDGDIPTTSQWESARVKSYGTAKLIKGEKWDVEYIAGLQVRHYH